MTPDIKTTPRLSRRGVLGVFWGAALAGLGLQAGGALYQFFQPRVFVREPALPQREFIRFRRSGLRFRRFFLRRRLGQERPRRDSARDCDERDR